MKNNKTYEIFEAKYNQVFSIILTVDITEKEDHYVIEAKKYKLSIKSTTKNLNTAKREFVEAFEAVTSSLINSQRLFSVMEHLGFKFGPYHVMMNQKIKEVNSSNRKVNMLSVDQDKLMKESFVNINRIDPSINWNSPTA